MGRKLKIAWFSPLNCGATPSSCLSAYVSDLLLPLLKDSFELHLFHNSFERYKDFQTSHFLSAVRHDAEESFDLFLYQLEDSIETNFARIHLGLKPGMVWFHNYLMSNFGPEPILNSPWEDTLKRLEDPARAWPRRDQKFKPKGGIAQREAALAFIALFSNPLDHSHFMENKLSRVRERSYYLPIPVVEREISKTANEYPTIAWCGKPGIESRAHKVLQAVSKLGERCKFIWLVDESELSAAKKLALEYGLNSVEIQAGRSPSSWESLLSSADLAIHTLFSDLGQLSPYLEQSLMAALPIIVTNYGAARSLPDYIFKVEPGVSEAYQIQVILERFLHAEVKLDRARIRRFAEDFFSARQVAAQLVRVICSSAENLSERKRCWNELESRARLELLREVSTSLPTSDWQALEPVVSELGWEAQ